MSFLQMSLRMHAGNPASDSAKLICISYNVQIDKQIFNKYRLVAISQVSHLFPFRTEKLRPAEPMVLLRVLCGRVGRRQANCKKH